jgi:simple sugar transport system substrate-binding protein
MVNAFNAAVSGKADGIAVALVDPSAFNDPVEQALAAGIPVVSYNADTKGNKRLCYIGATEMLHIVELNCERV